MKFEIKKTIILILFVISLIINILSIRTTYGKYKEEVNAAYEVGIRKWYVVINGEDIQDETKSLSTILEPTLIGNEHMKDGVLVPGREGYFEIDVDYTKVDVPFTYTFEAMQINEETKKLPDFEFFGYSVLEEASGFEIDSMANTISYVGIEEIDEDNIIETTDETTGDKKLEVIQEMVDAETGSRKNKILTATLTTPQVEEADPTEEVVEATEEDTIVEVGRIAQVTRKIVDATTGVELEAETVLFRLAQELDTSTNTARFAVIQTQDPTQLESYERYQNLGVYFRWNDTETNQMDNLADTTFRGDANPDTNVSNTILKYQGTLNFKQFVQEDLVAAQEVASTSEELEIQGTENSSEESDSQEAESTSEDDVQNAENIQE